jgi:hypothetical protein
MSGKAAIASSRSFALLRAYAERIGQNVAGNSVPLPEFLKLLEIKLFGHFPQRIVSRLRKTYPTQRVYQPFSRVRHLRHSASC